MTVSILTARSLYITGTDTGVGKTLVSAALLHRLRQILRALAQGFERAAL